MVLPFDPVTLALQACLDGVEIAARILLGLPLWIQVLLVLGMIVGCCRPAFTTAPGRGRSPA